MTFRNCGMPGSDFQYVASTRALTYGMLKRTELTFVTEFEARLTHKIPYV